MALIQRINPNNRNVVPGIGTDKNIYVKSGDINPLIDQVNTNTTDIATLAATNMYQGTLTLAANYPAVTEIDQYWLVAGAGVIGGTGPALEVGDMVIGIAVNAGGTHAAVGSSFMIIQKNMIPCTAAVLQTGADNSDFVTALCLANAGLDFEATSLLLDLDTFAVGGNAGTGFGTITTYGDQALYVRGGAGTAVGGGTLYLLGGTANADQGGGAIEVNAGAGVGTGNGGYITISAGDGGATFASGGNIILNAGDAPAGVGGDVAIEAGNSASGNNGGNITLYAGDSDDATGGYIEIISGGGGGNISGDLTFGTSGNGTAANYSTGQIWVYTGSAIGGNVSGQIYLETGSGGTTGNSGSMTLITGIGGSASGNSGGFTITTGDTTTGHSGAILLETGTVTTTGNAGNLTLSTGDSANGSPGDINIEAGNTDADGIAPGGVYIYSGRHFVANGPGGQIEIATGTGFGTAGGGAIDIYTGVGGENGNGGNMSLYCGDGGNTTGNGGSMTFTAGSATTDGSGGALTLNGGDAAGNYDGGTIRLAPGSGAGSGIDGDIQMVGFVQSQEDIGDKRGTPYYNVKTLKYTFGWSGAAGVDYLLPATADMAPYDLLLGAAHIIPPLAKVIHVLIHTTEASVFSGGPTTLVAGAGNVAGAGGIQYAPSATIYAANAINELAVGGQYGAATSASASDVYITQITPGANWSTQTAGKYSVYITYIDNQYVR